MRVLSIASVLGIKLAASQKGEEYDCGTFQLISGLPCCDNPEYRDYKPWWLPHSYATPVAQTALPIVILDTHDQNPTCGAKVDTDIRVIYDAAGGLNSLTGDVVQGFPRTSTRIRLAGQSSRGYKKKQFNIYNKPGASILDLPKQEEYRLYAPIADVTALKNWLVFSMDRCNGGWSPRARFVRAYLVAKDESGTVAPQDMGLYMLTEKIDRDGQKVDIDSHRCATAPDCGYVLEIDRNCLQGKEGACLRPESCVASKVEIKYPGTPTTEQRCFVQKYLRQMCRAADAAIGINETERACTSSGNCADTGCCTKPGYTCFMKNQFWGSCLKECTPGIHEDEAPEHQSPWSCETPCQTEPDPDSSTDLDDYIDAKSFYNQFVYTQLSMNVDAYVSSEYFHKHRGGKLRAGPQWDFNGAFGDNYEYEKVMDATGRDPREPDFGWIRDGSTAGPEPKTTGTLEEGLGWSQFLKNQKFVNGLICHYKNLRQFNMTDDRLMSIIDAGHAFLQLEGAVDNFLTDIDQHVGKLKAFVKSRVAWMDANIEKYALGLKGSCPEYSPPSESELLGSCQIPSVNDVISVAPTPPLPAFSPSPAPGDSVRVGNGEREESGSRNMHLLSGVLSIVLVCFGV